MKKVLITGGAGFVPSSLADGLLATGNYYVVAADNLLTGKIENTKTANKNYEFVNGDVNNFASIKKIMLENAFDYVFHYAAVVGVKRTLDNPLLVLEDIEGFKNILQLCVETKVKRVFFSSSSEVYGEPVEFPQNEETTPLNAKLPYAIVKNVGEAYCRSYSQMFGLDYTIFRFFNTYGPKQSPDFVIAKFLDAAINNKDITIYGDGSQTRTFCYIQDNVDATIAILENNLIINDVINLGSAIELPILAVAQKIIAITNSSSKIVHLPALKEGDMTRRLPDNTKMKNILNRNMVSLDEGLKIVLNARK